MRWTWIDRILELEKGRRILAVKNVSLAEEHLHDHFAATEARPAMPVMPATLIIEGMAQTAGILVGHARSFEEKVILAKVSKAEFSRDIGPGQTLFYSATIERIDETGAQTTGVVEVIDHAEGADAPRHTVGNIELMFSHIDQNMRGLGFPEHNFVFHDQFKDLLRNSGIEM
jgi:3-hydroxyacyl-[acyl-carrier-protein] dehydratase